MKEIDRREYPLERVQRLLSGIPFFNEVLRESEPQFHALLNLAEIMTAEPGETVIREGDSDTCLYFLLKGQLAVMAGGGDGQVLNYISPGEVFGALAMIREAPRTATIRVDDSAREAIVARLNYCHFRDLEDFSVLTLPTKLGFYRMLVHNIRWTLEVNRMQNPQHELVGSMRKIPLYTGPRGTADELSSLHQQAHALADILCLWNEAAQPQRNNLQVT